MSKRLLIIRHAERPLLNEGEIGNELKLTENGINTTKQFAKSLNDKIIDIHCSPVIRCIQTAQIIANEHTLSNLDIKISKLLGDPGFFIKDADLAWQTWLNKGSESINSHLLKGTETWPGFYPFAEAMTKMRNYIHEILLSFDEGLVILVTHDTILATLTSRFLPSPLELKDWPDFLGYLEIRQGEKSELLFNYIPITQQVQPDNYNTLRSGHKDQAY